MKAFRDFYNLSRVRNRYLEKNVQALETNNVYKSKIFNVEGSHFARTFGSSKAGWTASLLGQKQSWDVLWIS